MPSKSIKVLGKGSKERILPITDRAFNSVNNYVNVSREIFANEKSGQFLYKVCQTFHKMTFFLRRNVFNEIVSKKF